jgi:hypothetical protein
MKNKVAFEKEVYMCISDKLVEYDAEIQRFVCLEGGGSGFNKTDSKVNHGSWAVLDLFD